MELPPEDGRKADLGIGVRSGLVSASMELPPEDGRKWTSPHCPSPAFLLLQWSYRPKTVESGNLFELVSRLGPGFNGATARRR